MKRLLVAVAMMGTLALAPVSAQASTSTDLVYADGQTYVMLGATLVTNASPGVLNAPPMYILSFPVSGPGPVTLPSGYQPQCNPCTQEPVAYHDHLLTGAPGLGTSGTAFGNYAAPWRIVIMVYTRTYMESQDFTPVTSDDQLAAAEAAGDFQVINPTGVDPYQRWTANVLICPVIRAHSS
ncbi:MAG: hypothetical protein KGJ47_11130 [Acidobacteriota bacterium]|nr:hypothetical protein [Acidobacteriota bacterium]